MRVYVDNSVYGWVSVDVDPSHCMTTSQVLIYFLEAPAARSRFAGKKKRKIGIVDMTIMTPPEIRLFQYHLTKLIASVLQHEAFIGRVCTTLIQ